MPHASTNTAADSIHGAGFDGHYDDFEGGYTAGFETFTERVDMTPRLQGLPGGFCQAAHWGYVIKGKLTYRFPDHDETIEAGDAFYVPAGHSLIADAGTEMVFFSPTTDWQQTIEKISEKPPAAT